MVLIADNSAKQVSYYNQANCVDLILYFIYLLPGLLILRWYIHKHQHKERASKLILQDAVASGMLEPASLHPVVDPNKCIGCRSCTEACPEQEAHPVIGIIGGKARLVSPANCIGHGACKQACPVDAIELVFGTERRGIDIPLISPEFQTTVPGIYIAGELGGMGLIRNAVEQGRQAIDSIKQQKSKTNPDQLDVLIVGAGPAGFSASLAAMKEQLSSVTIEQDSLGGTVAHFPRGKLVMTQPAELPLYGKMKFREISKEALLEFWQDVESKTSLEINYEERVTGVTANTDGSGFSVTTNKSNYSSRTVLLTIGRRGTPRTLDVPGEELSKVVYRLIDPDQYRGQRVLVVGGGDSALEAATSIAEVSDSTVTLCYRSAAFSRAKPKNRDKAELLATNHKLRIMLNSNVKKITEKSVYIDNQGDIAELENDAVIISAGGILPTAFLRDIGIAVETKFGKA